MLENTLTAEEMIPLLTANGAYITFEEDFKGSLSPGKWADLVIFSGNITDADTEGLLDITALMTMIDGRVVFCKKGYEHLCVSAPEEDHTELPAEDPSANEGSDGTVIISAGQTIKIGVQGPASGPLSFLYLAMENAVNLSVEDFGGSLDEYRIRLVQVDDQCDEGEAGRAAANLLDAHPDVIGVVGPMCSSGVLGAIPVYEQVGLAVISGSANRAELAEMFGDRGLNSTIPLANQLAELGLEESFINSTPPAVDFFERYQSQYGEVPEDAKNYLPYIYDAVQMLLKSVESSATRDPNGRLIIVRSKLLTAIRTTQFEGVTGLVSLDENGRREMPE
jgi:ABC-type branched-subunit amino acid transport system substrate-binding protein